VHTIITNDIEALDTGCRKGDDGYMKHFILMVAIMLTASTARAERAYESEFKFAAMKANVDTQLLRAICFVESGFKARAVHHNDGTDGNTSYGICQLKLRTAKDMGFTGKVAQLRQASTNIQYAAEYLAFQLERYDNNVAKALIAYNRGSYKPGVDKRDRYVAAVLTAVYERR
jgi:soluble lytic murein transglycosylase-like protein